MFAKVLNILLVYFLCIANFAFLTIPFIILLSPLLLIKGSLGINVIISCIVIFGFAVSSIVLLFWFLDFLFAISVRQYIKNTKPYSHKKYAIYKEYIDNAYKIIKQKYNISFKILIKDSDSIEAFATGGFGLKIVVISNATLEKLELKSKDPEEFQIAIAGLLGHEASHLLNKDFLPGTLLATNQKATSIFANISGLAMSCVFMILSTIPYFGKYAKALAKLVYKNSHYILGFFMNKILLPFYFFISKILSRSIEYRSDNDSAKAFGNLGVSLCLQMLAGNDYNSIFSTHPSTSKRILHVKSVAEQKRVDAKFAVQILNYLSIILIVLTPFILYDLIIHHLPSKEFYHLARSLQQSIHSLSSLFF